MCIRDRIGNKWSFDEENRKKLPKDISIPKFPKITETAHTKKLKILVDKNFKSHPGNTKDFWFATEYDDVIKLLNFFIKVINKILTIFTFNLFLDFISYLWRKIPSQ